LVWKIDATLMIQHTGKIIIIFICNTANMCPILYCSYTYIYLKYSNYEWQLRHRLRVNFTNSPRRFSDP